MKVPKKKGKTAVLVIEKKIFEKIGKIWLKTTYISRGVKKYPKTYREGKKQALFVACDIGNKGITSLLYKTL